MNFKTTFALILLLAVLAGAVFYIQRTPSEPDKATADTSKSSAGKALFTIKPPDVATLTLKPATGDEVSLKKVGANWRMTKPVDAAANTRAVDMLLGDLLALKSAGQVELDQTAGLNPARLSIALTTKSGESLNLAIGDRTALGDVMYVQVAGNSKVDVSPAGSYDQLFKPVNDLRDTALVHATPAQIDEVAVQQSGGPEVVLRKNDGKWEEVAPKAFAADSGVMDSFLSSVTGLSASTFLKPGASTRPAHLDEPQLTVSFRTAVPTTPAASTVVGPPVPTKKVPGPQTTIRLGQYEDVRKENVYATVSDTGEVVKVAAWSLDQLKKSPLDFRDRNLVAINPDGVERFSVSVNRKATTQPTTMPAELHEYAIARRPVAPEVIPTTQPTTKPTAPATQPSATGTRQMELASSQLAYTFADDAPAAPAADAPKPAPESPTPTGSATTPVPTPDAPKLSESPATTPVPSDKPAADGSSAVPATQPASPATKPAWWRKPGTASEPGVVPAASLPATAAPDAIPATLPSLATTRPGDVSAIMPASQPTGDTAQATPTTQPALIATPATMPATAPAIASTQPAVPSAPPSKWYFVSGGQGDAEEGQVDALLETFKAMKVDKYIEPGHFEGSTYTVVLHTIAQKAGESATDHAFTFIDMGTRVVGTYKDLAFEVDRSILDKITGDFKTKKPPAPAPVRPQFPGGMGGFPGAGMPGGE